MSDSIRNPTSTVLSLKEMGEQKRAERVRLQERIRELYHTESMTRPQLAERFGISIGRIDGILYGNGRKAVKGND